jgi:hypothetical protein
MVFRIKEDNDFFRINRGEEALYVLENIFISLFLFAIKTSLI